MTRILVVVCGFRPPPPLLPLLLLPTTTTTTTSKLSSPTPPARGVTHSPSRVCSPFSVVRQPAAAASGLGRVTIANPGSTQGLRAKFGRLFSFTSSGTSTEASKTGLTAAVVSPHPQENVVEEREGKSGPLSYSTATGGGMQTLYVSHGAPMLAIQYDDPARQFMIDLGPQLPKPKAIVIISAHWDTTEPTVTCAKKNETIYDFYGFPSELYKLRYDAPGDPELAHKIVDLLKQGGFPKAKINERRGLDHGAWIPLLLMYPETSVPVIQLSVQYRKDGAHHYKVGQALSSLKNEGVLVIGSGSATHNVRSLNFDDGPVAPWALAFDDWLNDALCKNRYEDVINYIEKAPNARKAHPTSDHFLPFIIALGAAGQDAVGERIHTSWIMRTISMGAWALKPPPSAAASA